MPAHVGHREPPHVAERPGDRIAERVLAPGQLARLIVDVHVAPAVVEVFEDLFDDDLALELDVARTPAHRRDRRGSPCRAGSTAGGARSDRASSRARSRRTACRPAPRSRGSARTTTGSAPSRGTACAPGSARGRWSRASRSASRRARRGRRSRCAGAASRRRPAQPVRQPGAPDPVRRLSDCDGVVGQVCRGEFTKHPRGEARTKHAFATVVVFGGDGRDGLRRCERSGGPTSHTAAPWVCGAGELGVAATWARPGG